MHTAESAMAISAPKIAAGARVPAFDFALRSLSPRSFQCSKCPSTTVAPPVGAVALGVGIEVGEVVELTMGLLAGVGYELIVLLAVESGVNQGVATLLALGCAVSVDDGLTSTLVLVADWLGALVGVLVLVLDAAAVGSWVMVEEVVGSAVCVAVTETAALAVALAVLVLVAVELPLGTLVEVALALTGGSAVMLGVIVLVADALLVDVELAVPVLLAEGDREGVLLGVLVVVGDLVGSGHLQMSQEPRGGKATATQGHVAQSADSSQSSPLASGGTQFP